MGAFARADRRAQVQAAFGAQRLEHVDTGVFRRVDVYALPAVIALSRNVQPNRFLTGGNGRFAQIVCPVLIPEKRRFVDAQPVPGAGRELVDPNRFAHDDNSFLDQPMLPFISRRMRLFISTAYSSGSSLETLSAKPLTISARASSSLMPRLIR